MYWNLNSVLVTLLLSNSHLTGTYFHYAKGVVSNENEVWEEEWWQERISANVFPFNILNPLCFHDNAL